MLEAVNRHLSATLAEARDKRLREWLILTAFGLAVFVGAVVCMELFTRHWKLAWGITPSLDKRLFLIDLGNLSIQRGDYVAFRTPDLRPYYPAGSLFCKRVVGVPGDTILRDGQNFLLCNGESGRCRWFEARRTDSQGRPAPQFWPQTERIPEGCYFVVGTHPRSFDSRYWGYVRRKAIVGKAMPIL